MTAPFPPDHPAMQIETEVRVPIEHLRAVMNIVEDHPRWKAGMRPPPAEYVALLLREADGRNSARRAVADGICPSCGGQGAHRQIGCRACHDTGKVAAP